MCAGQLLNDHCKCIGIRMCLLSSSAELGPVAYAKAWKDQQLAEYVSKPYFYTENGVWAPAARVPCGRCYFVLQDSGSRYHCLAVS